MKKIKPTLFLLSIILIIAACNKNGEIVKYPSFGSLNISGTLSSPLIIKIDGKIIDTLNAASNGLVTPVEEGNHKISLLNSAKKSVIDTVLTFQKRKTRYLTNFFYTGYGVLFPDPDKTRKPTRGNMLVRFVITDKTLPNELNLKLFVLDFGTGISTPLNIKINGVRKDKFSNYIELHNPGSSDFYYLLEGYDLSGKKIMSIDNNTYGFIVSDNNSYAPFTENSIISLGIGPGNESDPSHIPQVIFQRIAK
jgi:hypothetical protein